MPNYTTINDNMDSIQETIIDGGVRPVDSSKGSSLAIPMLGSNRRVMTQIDLTWRNLSYEVDIPKSKGVAAHRRKLLDNIAGHVTSGEMMAIMGPSGAGKTTLLDILARRQKGGDVSGCLMMNGRPIDKKVFRCVSAYVQQQDILHGYLTVRETITYAARLRTSSNVTMTEIHRKVDHVMKLLGIDHVANTKIGSEFVRGVSGGEKKRTAIAVELVTDPSLLYLDEPTTGLDTFTALHLLTILKNLTKLGVAVVFSIHQPRSTIFRMFDSLLLLNGFGEQAYFGRAADAMPFLGSIGITSQEPDNPADFLLDAVSVIRSSEGMSRDEFPFLPPPNQSRDISAAFASARKGKIIDQVDQVVLQYTEDSHLPEGMSSPYYRPFHYQVLVVAKRAFMNKVRDPIATIVAIIVSMTFAVLVGSIYFQLERNQPNIQDRLGVLFFLTMNTAFSNLGSLAMFLFDRSIYVREHRNGMYRPSSYYIGKIIQDVPLAILTNLCFTLTAYYMIGLQKSFLKFIQFFGIATLVMLNSYGVCMFVSNISPNYQVANIVAPLLLVLYLIPSGFLISLDSIPAMWSWLQHISFFRFGFQALVINEFSGLTFDDCSEDWENCTYRGEDYFERMLGFHEKDFNLLVIFNAVSCLTYIVLGYLCLRFFRHNEGK